MSRIISKSDVKKHNRINDLWFIIHNDVYDVTKFLSEHPGGEDTLMDNAGKDATGPFEDVGHSADARELLKKYKIGTLPPEEQDTGNAEGCNWKWILLAALLSAVVIGVVLKRRG